MYAVTGAPASTKLTINGEAATCWQGESGQPWVLTGPNAERSTARSRSTTSKTCEARWPGRFLFQPAGTLSGSLMARGEDRLDYSPWQNSVQVNLATGAATAIQGGVKNIEDVTGGAGDDVILGDAQPNILHGGGGNDILVGGAGNDQLFGDDGRDILIGGTGADRLDGGAGEDLLIGGTTSYDANIAALTALMAEWQRLAWITPIALTTSATAVATIWRSSSTTRPTTRPCSTTRPATS